MQKKFADVIARLREWLHREYVQCFHCSGLHQVDFKFAGFRIFVCDKL